VKSESPGARRVIRTKSQNLRRRAENVADFFRTRIDQSDIDEIRLK
jgi:hypothetical protein